MNKSKSSTIQVRILFEDYWIRLVLDGGRNSFALTAGEMIELALKKLESMRFVVCNDSNYGLFERSKGIERLIPDETDLMRNRSLLSGNPEFIIRPKSYFETNGYSNSKLTKERIKKCYRRLSGVNKRLEKKFDDYLLRKEKRQNESFKKRKDKNMEDDNENDEINRVLSAKIYERLVSETKKIISSGGFQMSITKRLIIIEEESIVAVEI